jgi:hypothetical protein
MQGALVWRGKFEKKVKKGECYFCRRSNKDNKPIPKRSILE